MQTWQKFAAVAALTLAAIPAPIFARSHAPCTEPEPHDPAAVLTEDPTPAPTPDNFPERSAEKSGTIPTKGGRTLRVNVELGNVHVFTDETARISYRVIVEADAR